MREIITASTLAPCNIPIVSLSVWDNETLKENLIRLVTLMRSVNEYTTLKRLNLGEEERQAAFSSIADVDFMDRVLPGDIILLLQRGYQIDKTVFICGHGSFEPRKGDVPIREALVMLENDRVSYKGRDLDPSRSLSSYGIKHGEPISLISV